MTNTERCPRAIVIGRLAIYTRNRFLARDIEQKLEQQGVPGLMTSGVIREAGESVYWVALPAAKN